MYIYIYICRNFRWKQTIAQELFKTFHQCACNNLANFLLKKYNVKGFD